MVELVHQNIFVLQITAKINMIILKETTVMLKWKKIEEIKSKVELDEAIKIRHLFSQFTLKGTINKFGEYR